MVTWKRTLTGFLLLSFSAVAQQPTDGSPSAQSKAATAPQATAQSSPDSSTVPAVQPPPTTMDQVVDRAIQREHALMSFLSSRTPLVETYLQNFKPDPNLGAVPKEDHYFLGRIDLASVDRHDYLSKNKHFEKNLLGGFTKLFRSEYQPIGFSWMIFADRDDFGRIHYDFKYSHREFVGDVRCMVFDVTPKKDSGKGRFVGRIWVEDQDYNIVRLNGTYAPRPKNAYFFHMDSWRLNLIPGYWLPAYIYSEEGDFSYGRKDKVAFKVQSRVWGYNLKQASKEDELTAVKVDAVKDESPIAADASPLEAQRQWQQQAEDNVVVRLEQAGLLAPAGDVDKVLDTVINNLIVTNNLVLARPIHARVMLTTPLETFSMGNTLVVSRGLIDVLPDESSLAAVLSHELAHIALGHNLGSKFAFNDRMFFSDDRTYANFGFRHSPAEETAADAKAMELLRNSPYAQKLDTASLFFKQLSARAPQLRALLTTHLGNRFTTDKGQLVRLVALARTGPALDMKKLDQIAALPLGGRIKLNAWDDKIELSKSAPVAIVTARDKMPLEVTPFFPHLTRLNETEIPAAQTASVESPADTAPPHERLNPGTR
jgi:hypothetical protein